MKEALFKSKYWIFANLLGILLYLYLASKLWAPVGERGLEGGPGDPIIWTTTALPVLVLFSLLNIAWFLLIVLRFKKKKSWQPLIIWLVVILAWFGANRHDAHQQYTGDAVKKYIQPGS